MAAHTLALYPYKMSLPLRKKSSKSHSSRRVVPDSPVAKPLIYSAIEPQRHAHDYRGN